MFKVAILVDLELSRKSGGHVKFWERIYKSLEKEKTKGAYILRGYYKHLFLNELLGALMDYTMAIEI